MTRDWYFAAGFEAGKKGESSTCRYKAHWRFKAWRDGWYMGRQADQTEVVPPPTRRFFHRLQR